MPKQGQMTCSEHTTHISRTGARWLRHVVGEAHRGTAEHKQSFYVGISLSMTDATKGACMLLMKRMGMPSQGYSSNTECRSKKVEFEAVSPMPGCLRHMTRSG
jgi:hypothetical protein